MPRLETILTTDENPYTLLGLARHQTSLISSAMIRRAYFHRARVCHPDRCPDRQDEFVKLQASYELLIDPNNRRLWDQQQQQQQQHEECVGQDDLDPHELRQYHQQVQYIAECQRASMEFAYRSNVDLETKRHGLIILRAVYGKLPASGYHGNEKDCRLDVVQALQCLVHQSQLTIDAGEPKWRLEGFYVPPQALVNHCLLLRVCYYYQNQLHEVQVTDTEALRLPLVSHAIGIGADTCCPRAKTTTKPSLSSPHYESMLRHQRRKQWLTWTSVVLAVGFVYTRSSSSSTHKS